MYDISINRTCNVEFNTTDLNNKIDNKYINAK